MAHILLMHSALGLRPAVTTFADALREDGHTVDVPDYYEGAVFNSEREGIGYRDTVGVQVLMERAATHLDALPDDAVLAGFSLGAFFAQVFAARRPHARAALLLHSAAAPRGEWNGVPVQIHRYAVDPWIDEPDITALGAAVRTSGAAFEDVVVPGRGHLFTDLDTPDGDADALDVSMARIRSFLAGSR